MVYLIFSIRKSDLRCTSINQTSVNQENTAKVKVPLKSTPFVSLLAEFLESHDVNSMSNSPELFAESERDFRILECSEAVRGNRNLIFWYADGMARHDVARHPVERLGRK